MEIDEKSKDRSELDRINKNDVGSFDKINSWKMKRTVFRDWISIIQPDDDWSLFNLVQTIKQKAYGLPRKVFEVPKETKPTTPTHQQTPKEKSQPATEIQTPGPNSQSDDKVIVPQVEEKLSKSPEKQPEKIEEEPVVSTIEVVKEVSSNLPQVTMVPSSDTIGESSLVKRKPEIDSDREDLDTK